MNETERERKRSTRKRWKQSKVKSKEAQKESKWVKGLLELTSASQRINRLGPKLTKEAEDSINKLKSLKAERNETTDTKQQEKKKRQVHKRREEKRREEKRREEKRREENEKEKEKEKENTLFLATFLSEGKRKAEEQRRKARAPRMK